MIGEKVSEGPTPTTVPGSPVSLGPTVGESAVEGRYVLDREIGQGGMGRVYEGRDRLLVRTVAIKTTRDPRGTHRFEQEVRLAARLQHPGIVTVYDAGFFSTGEPFLVMKRILGQSLSKVISDAETLADRLALLPSLIAAADAVAYAHDQGVIHRDLKPGNILVGAFGETVVVDFGLAKDLSSTEGTSGGGASAGLGLTQDGTVMGTPPYMAPEQSAGDPVDARADVYALGAVIFHGLSGQPPAPDHRLEQLEPRVPAPLLAIVEKAMATDKGQRYPTAFELSEDLRRFHAGQWVAAQGYSLPTHARGIARRHGLWLGVGIGVAATLLLRWLFG